PLRGLLWNLPAHFVHFSLSLASSTSTIFAESTPLDVSVNCTTDNGFLVTSSMVFHLVPCKGSEARARLETRDSPNTLRVVFIIIRPQLI
ncbi:MAG: hypothetical protein NT127_02980, partial [Sphingobacteriales bacterium]|nr:hypothetical protein [Sphingobacteriales bacterium]